MRRPKRVFFYPFGHISEKEAQIVALFEENIVVFGPIVPWGKGMKKETSINYLRAIATLLITNSHFDALYPASLSFLGLGAQLPTPEWGLMISMGRTYFPDKWWYCIFPGVAIFITVLCFNLIGDAIREILDPKTRKK